jgi:DNA-binding transcriptional MerR regulator
MDDFLQEKRYSVAEFAAIVERSPTTIYGWQRRGLITPKRVESGARKVRSPLYYYCDADIPVGRRLARTLPARQPKKSAKTRRKRTAQRKEAIALTNAIVSTMVLSDPKTVKAIAKAVKVSIEDVQDFLKREKQDFFQSATEPD